ncbi:MAG: hypothetical protein KJZ78_26510 [Bryobacteraceae bacterium]|nr:hypothetical protein [Bryobacteraceae bacterium]HEU0142291.1 hypothetical protein [Bryobacteraceae bacterium]
MSKERVFEDVRKILAYDEAVLKLQQAGLAEAFVTAVEKDPELKASVQKLAPNLTGAASPGWSCCVTVSNPLRSPGEAVINPAIVTQPIKK